MKSFIIVLLFILFQITSFFGQENITEISFKRGGRGYHQSIIIRPDSTLIYEYSRKGIMDIKKQTDKSMWQRAINSIAEYKLSELEHLLAPTHAVASDGALGASIEIITDTKKYECGGFDNYNPNKKLTNLMNVILEVWRGK